MKISIYKENAYTNNALNEIIIEDLDKSILYNKREYYAARMMFVYEIKDYMTSTCLVSTGKR